VASGLPAADTPLLAGLWHEVYVLQSRTGGGLKRAYPTGGKTDCRDAFFMLSGCASAACRLLSRWTCSNAPLQRLTRFRAHLAQSLAREKNYFLSFLWLKFSAFSQEEPFGDPFGATSSLVLDQYAVEDLVQWPVDDLAAFLQRQGRGGFDNPAEVAATLTKAARDSYGWIKCWPNRCPLCWPPTMATIRTLQAQLKAVDATIARELASIPEVRRTIPLRIPGWDRSGRLAWSQKSATSTALPRRWRLAKYAGPGLASL